LIIVLKVQHFQVPIIIIYIYSILLRLKYNTSTINYIGKDSVQLNDQPQSIIFCIVIVTYCLFLYFIQPVFTLKQVIFYYK